MLLLRTWTHRFPGLVDAGDLTLALTWTASLFSAAPCCHLFQFISLINKMPAEPQARVGVGVLLVKRTATGPHVLIGKR